ncbi:MAG: S8 family serine peptidase [Leptospiraceae bacterium]|nr:S8 family serine peptidase [Leptospiraceae bacterium]
MKFHHIILTLIFIWITNCSLKVPDVTPYLVALFLQWDDSSNAIPSTNAKNVSFVDSDGSFNKIGGELKITKSDDEVDIDSYVVYWGESETAKSNSTPVVTITKTGEDIIYTISSDTNLPFEANYFLVYSKNASGESSTPVSVAIIDLDTSDPLFLYQWHLVNTGQSTFSDNPGTAGFDINLKSTIRSGLTGKGVTIAIVDTGLEIAHEDLAGNVVTGGSWDFVGSDNDPTYPYALPNYDHGTNVAGVLGAVGFNKIGGRGVALGVSLKGFNLISAYSISNEIASLGGATGTPFNSSDVDIFNMSFGFNNTNSLTIDPTLLTFFEAVTDPSTGLRNGKGAIYVKSPGNGYLDFRNGDGGCNLAQSIGISCQNSNMDPTNAIPYVIMVGAINASGTAASYSTAGSSLFLSAPGGEFGASVNYIASAPSYAYYPAILTVDQSGCDKGTSSYYTFNSFQTANSLNQNCNYTSTFNGSSAAAPIVSGAIALMLEANPQLTWRDVKYILAKTARQIDSSNSGITSGSYQADLGWITNAAGYKFHNRYGFGLLDVDNAVKLAKNYSVNLGSFSNYQSGVSSVNTSIPNNSSTGTSNTISVPSNLSIEAVQITVNITHTYCGDLGIELTSPSGTKSILFTINNGFLNSANLTNMVLLSNAFYGESSVGNWTIKVVDMGTGGSGTFGNWKIKIYGH